MTQNGRKDKSLGLLGFLEEFTRLRQVPVRDCKQYEEVLWFNEIPKNLITARPAFATSPFLEDPSEATASFWLEVRKRPEPPRPPLPAVLRPFERELSLDDPSKAPALPKTSDATKYKSVWEEYFRQKWLPWSQQHLLWQSGQTLYETIDRMRRQIEKSEEEYELLVAFGLLEWKPEEAPPIRRHLFTGPAEIALEAEHGILTMSPAETFEGFRLELDMLEDHQRPVFDQADQRDLEQRLERLDSEAWKPDLVAPLLRRVGNRLSAKTRIEESEPLPSGRLDSTPRVRYAPALILRRRRMTGLQGCLASLRRQLEQNGATGLPKPWRLLVEDGQAETAWPEEPDDPPRSPTASSGPYFPLPTNAEQREIADRLEKQPCVLVKGPPGTGKSHTIANLVSHLLASGERVLVTAHAPKALIVLRQLIPEGLRSLCVTAFGSGREDQQLLEQSVRGILARCDRLMSGTSPEEEIARLEKSLRQLEARRNELEGRLRKIREAETHRKEVAGYCGTAPEIARQLEAEAEAWSWFPEPPVPEAACPFTAGEIEFLARFHGELTPDRHRELTAELGEADLPGPDEFAKRVAALEEAEAKYRQLSGLDQTSLLSGTAGAKDEEVNALADWLEELGVTATRLRGLLDRDGEAILAELLEGGQGRWPAVLDRLRRHITSAREALEVVGTSDVHIDPSTDQDRLLADTAERLSHLQSGGWRGWWILAPAVIRRTNYILEVARVDGRSPHSEAALEKLHARLRLQQIITACIQELPPVARLMPPEAGPPAVDLLEGCRKELEGLVSLFKPSHLSLLRWIPVAQRKSVVSPDGLRQVLRCLEAEKARREVERLGNALRAPLPGLESLALAGRAHACVLELKKAIEMRDPELWARAWTQRNQLRAAQRELHRYQELLDRLAGQHPGLAMLLTATQGQRDWRERLVHLEKAWRWAAARAWLRRFADPGAYALALDECRRVRDDIRKVTAELAERRAWAAFVRRLDYDTRQALVAWTKAMKRIGKGTGIHANRHRRSARKYLKDCLPQMPAWIMPIHKLWDTVDASPGVFDTVIVDEASQADVSSLPLLLLAKRIVVVGDDMQASPEGVGVSEDRLQELVRNHLSSFKFADEFRADASLYDHAERIAHHPIVLREHFRCVPEIIAFSNALCYGDSPLIPLRQPPVDRLVPLRASFVASGACEGKDASVVNRQEARAIVNEIQKCLDDPAYRGKTMGVIVLQGTKQIAYIESELARILTPKQREDRKLRCGRPADFQGDQRDVIFLSLVVAPNYNYRALTTLDDRRRFNVAMSRARDQVWLFHSVQAGDLSPEDLRHRLLKFFYTPQLAEEPLETGAELDRLEDAWQRYQGRSGLQPEPYESWFEVEVAIELLRRGYKVLPQYRVAGYRIDLVIEGGVRRLAVECDGDAWHGPERADADAARQLQLERAGWCVIRIRGSEFYCDRERTVERILRECERLGISPAHRAQSEVTAG